MLVSTEAREGTWSAATRGSGLAVDWPGENTALRPGDRLVEVNGTSMVSCRSAEELQRALGSGSARIVVMRTSHNPPHAQHPPQPPAPAFTQNEAASLRAELGALRSAAEEAERAKEGLRTDNTRLTHRISYLEEQVAEMIARHAQLQPVSSTDSSCITVNKTKKNVTNISITSEPQARSRHSSKSEVQVFQKGPDITAIVAKLPGLEGAEPNLPLMRPRSNASGASSRAAVSPRASPPPPPHLRAHSAHSLEHRTRMRHSLSHHCIHGAVDYSAETDAAIRMIERNQRHIEKQRLKSERLCRPGGDDRLRPDGDLEPRDSHSSAGRSDARRAADRIEESIKKTNWAERKTLSIIEQLKRSQRLRKQKKADSAEDVRPEAEKLACRRIDGKVLENAHKSSRRSSKLHSRSARSSEFESECSDFPNGDAYGSSPRTDCGSERLGPYRNGDGDGRARPTPPRKPLRLSLHKARSAHSLMNGSETEAPSGPPSEAPGGEGKRPVKRTHAADRWARDGARATPRPARRLHGLAPAADALYPEPPHHLHAARWC